MLKTLNRCQKLLKIRNTEFVQAMRKTDCPPIKNICDTKIECLMDLHPLPNECWQDHYDRKRQKGKLIFCFGLVNFITVLVCYSKVGILAGYPEVGPLEKVWELFEKKN